MLINMYLGTNRLTPIDEKIDTGFFSGFVPWSPPQAVLKAEALGYSPAELKPFLRPLEVSLIVLQENPSKALAFFTFPKSNEKCPSSYDAINFTKKETLIIQADGKEVPLKANQRVRLSRSKALSYSFCGSEEFTINPADNHNYILVFYTTASGIVDCFVTFDQSM